MPQVLKRRAIEALQKLHAKGVCHNALSLDNILIGADANIYFFNFHHARYTKRNPALQLKEPKEIDFALEKRRLEFQLDYDNARKKEKDRLALAIQRQRNNDIELRKQKMDPSYEPKFIVLERTPPFTLPRFESWVSDLDRQPRRLIMPGQTVEDFEWELKRFYNILQKMEDLDRAAGLTESPVQGNDIKVEMGPSTAEDEMVKLEDEDIEMSTNEHHCRPLKRKRSTEVEDSSSFVSKRLRRTSQPNVGSSKSQVRSQFKNEELRPSKLPEYMVRHGLAHRFLSTGVKLVSSYEIEPSVQENNLVPQWPIVVVRDFQKQPPPEIGGALRALVKRNADKFKEEQDQEKARREVEQKSGSSSWLSLWNPLRYLFSKSQSDDGGQEKERKSQGAIIPPLLSCFTDLDLRDPCFWKSSSQEARDLSVHTDYPQQLVRMDFKCHACIWFCRVGILFKT